MMLNPLRSAAPSRATARTGPTARSATSTGGFEPISASRGASPSQPLSAVASLDSLMALQAIDGPLEKRKRVARRGIAILDDLDALKIAILEGRIGPDDLERLRRLAASAREASDDVGLEALIDGVELRAAVEIAKLGG